MTPLAAYLQRRDANEAFNQESQAGELRQAGALQALIANQDKMRRDEAMRQSIAASGGDVEAALTGALKSGNVSAAHELAPLVRMAHERKREEQTRKGLAALLADHGGLQQHPMTPGPGSSIMAGSGQVTPPAAMVSPPAVAKQARLKKLNEMSVLYANNPTVLSRIQAEIGKLEAEPKTEKTELSALGKLIAERDKHPLGSDERKVYEQAITKFQPGGIQVNVSPNAPIIPGKPAQNKVDEGLLDSGMRQQQLMSIERQFKPEYQQLGTRWSALTLGVKDKLGLSDLDPGQKQFLTEFSQYKRNSIDALNQYIKSVTGAAMTNAEAERILRGLPNPGTGLLDGDSPTEFKAKLDDALRQTRMAEARLVYIKRNGMNLGDVALDRMPSLMNQRGAEIEKAIKAQNAKLADADVRKLVRRNLAQEFGLVE